MGPALGRTGATSDESDQCCLTAGKSYLQSVEQAFRLPPKRKTPVFHFVSRYPGRKPVSGRVWAWLGAPICRPCGMPVGGGETKRSFFAASAPACPSRRGQPVLGFAAPNREKRRPKPAAYYPESTGQHKTPSEIGNNPQLRKDCDRLCGCWRDEKAPRAESCDEPLSNLRPRNPFALLQSCRSVSGSAPTRLIIYRGYNRR